MATIVERDVHHDHASGDSSSVATLAIAIIAILFILGLGLFLLRGNFGPVTNPADTGAGGVDVNIDSQIPVNPAQ